MAKFYGSREGKAGEWRCVVVNEPWNDRIQVYLMREHNGAQETAFIDKDGMLGLKKAVEGSTKPLFTISWTAHEALLQALGSVEPQIEKEVVDSELKATKFHLDDMRRLIFENRKDKTESRTIGEL